MEPGLTVKSPGATPVALKAIVRFGFDPLEVMPSEPAALPDAAGVKLTLNVKLWPALSVTGGLMPVKEKPVPEGATCEIVSAEPP